MRWAVPFLTAKPGVVPKEHDNCTGETVCPQCDAQEWLTDDDWQVITFYQHVSDLVTNLAPLGTEDKKQWLVPRLSDWLLMADLLGIEQQDRLRLINQTRYLSTLLQGRERKRREVYVMDPLELMPPETEYDDD